MFAQRAIAAARRLGVSAEIIAPGDLGTHGWNLGDVVVLQATLRPERQLTLVDQLVHAATAPIVVAVTGHLETELRRELKARGVRLAAHSAMDRVLARALDLSDDDVDAAATPHPEA